MKQYQTRTSAVIKHVLMINFPTNAVSSKRTLKPFTNWLYKLGILIIYMKNAAAVQFCIKATRPLLL